MVTPTKWELLAEPPFMCVNQHMDVATHSSLLYHIITYTAYMQNCIMFHAWSLDTRQPNQRLRTSGYTPAHLIAACDLHDDLR